MNENMDMVDGKLTAAAALLRAEKSFRRLNGCEQLKDLEKSLLTIQTLSTLETPK